MFDAVKYKISKLRSLIGVRDKFLQYADWFKYCSMSSFSMNQECFPMYFSSASSLVRKWEDDLWYLIKTISSWSCCSQHHRPPAWHQNRKADSFYLPPFIRRGGEMLNCKRLKEKIKKKTRQEQCWAMTIYLFSTFFPIHNHTVFLHVWTNGGSNILRRKCTRSQNW